MNSECEKLPKANFYNGKEQCDGPFIWCLCCGKKLHPQTANLTYKIHIPSREGSKFTTKLVDAYFHPECANKMGQEFISVTWQHRLEWVSE